MGSKVTADDAALGGGEASGLEGLILRALSCSPPRRRRVNDEHRNGRRRVGVEFRRGDIGLLVRLRWVVACWYPGVRQLIAD